MCFIIKSKKQVLYLVLLDEQCTFLGCDIHLKSAKQPFADQCVKVVVVGSSLGNTFLSIKAICNQFNVIIDGGAQKFNLMLNSFINDFPMVKLERRL
jgi:hypothetical protein